MATKAYWLGNLKFYMLQVKIKFRLKFFNLGWVFQALIHELLGLRDKGNREY